VEDRQHANSKRRQEDDQARAQARNEPKHTRYEQKEAKEEKGKMQLNGVDMVAVAPTPAPVPIHPSLPVKPTQSAAVRLPGSGGGAVEVATTKRGITVIGGSAQSVLDNRRANRMAAMNAGVNANLSAAEALKAELAGDGADSMEAASIDKPSTAVSGSGDASATAVEADAYAETEAAEDQESPRGKKRKAVEQRPDVAEATAAAEEDAEGEDEDDDDAEGEDDDDTEAPPNPEADQPLPKKAKLKVNPDGTVEYDDTVM
jgi:5'-3' exoribonuclease 2